jgi:hypothetical protein
VTNYGFLLGVPVLLATALWSGVANAARAHAVEPAAMRSARTNLIVAQTFHERPGIPGSSDSGDIGGPVDGSHAPPSVPNFGGSGSASGGSPAVSGGAGSSHAAPGLPSFSDDAGNAAAQSHAPSPATNGVGGSHAAPGVPMMGGNP